MFVKAVILLTIAMNFQLRRAFAEWKPLQADENGADPRRYDQYEAAAEEAEEAEAAGDGGGGLLKSIQMADLAGRRPTDMDENPAYAVASISVDEDSADASSLDHGQYVDGATEAQDTDDRWSAAASAQSSRKKRDASEFNRLANAWRLKPYKTFGGSSKALSADIKGSPLRRSKRTHSPLELQRMVIFGSLLNNDNDDDSRRSISSYGALKRVPAPPVKSRVAAGMRYAGIGKRKVNVRSRVDAGMRYMGIGKRQFF